MMATYTAYRKQTGFGLLELMIALALGVLVIGGIVQVFYSTSQTYRMQQAMSRVQEAGRYAIGLMTPELRKAGKLNFCIAELDVQNRLDTTSADYEAELFSPDQAIVGWNFNDTDIGDTYNLPDPLTAGATSGASWVSTNGNALPDLLADLSIPGSDLLLIKSADQVPGMTVCGNVSSNANLPVNTNNNSGCAPLPQVRGDGSNGTLTDRELEELVPSGGILLITNCTTGGDLIQRTNNSTANNLNVNGGNVSPGNDNGLGWSTSYDDTAQVYSVRSVAFFVGTNPAGTNSLYRINLGNGGSGAIPEELVEGVESMQVLFGVMTDNSGRLQYVEPDQVTTVGSPINIVSAQISFLVRSEANADLELDDQTYVLSQTTIDPVDDSRLRRVFSTTVGIRNRIGS